MFAALTFDRDPLKLGDLSFGVLAWLQGAGGFATVGLILFLLVGLPRWRARDRQAIPGWMTTVFLGAAGISLTAYLLYFALFLGDVGRQLVPLFHFYITVLDLLLCLAGAASLIAVLLPFLVNLTRVRFRRVYALAKLSFKEAIRRRVLYAFTGMLLVFLFASWFIPSMPKDQVRTYVGVVFLAMTYLLLFTGATLSSFSIPADIKQQTIHTIVTKPVERFEIVLGRFLGFLGLMTVVLVVMTGISLLYVLRGIHPEAAAESLKARIPFYGDLTFENTEVDGKGTNVGREWEYRSYITRPMPGQPPQTARWNFAALPPSLGSRDQVRCEYSFDVYRTTKGEEGRDVFCTFRFYTWRFVAGNEPAFRKERDEMTRAGLPRDEINNRLAEKYGFFEINAQPVTDYRTQFFVLPGGLFRNALAADPERASELQSQEGGMRPPLIVRVTSESATQYVGMARYDFYMRLDDSSTSDQTRFSMNFFKGAFGIWLQLALVVGLAVVLSTYLNGVISLLVTAVLFFGGLGRDFVQSVAFGRNPGGGPMEALVRMSKRELTGAAMSESTSISDQIVSRSDDVFRWFIRRVIDIIPDVDRFDFTQYVAEGFDVSGGQMLVTFLLLAGYLLPWFVLAYYLMRWREIAGAT